MQNWILNKETGRYELFEDNEKEQAKKVQKALFDYHMESLRGSE